LSTNGARRRVPGLRREEVALLAGVSVDYYTRLERGNAAGVSDTVLGALARALQLDAAERAHLLDLVQAAKGTTRPLPQPASEPLRPSMYHVLEALTGAPALLRNGRHDILAANQLGIALHAPIFERRIGPVNHARFFFLDPRATDLYVDWDYIAERAVAQLRAEVGRNPDDRALSDLAEELSISSDTFRSWWLAHDVSFIEFSILLRFRHPAVGELNLTFEAMPVAGIPGVWLIVYVAEPGSDSERTLGHLAEWAARTGIENGWTSPRALAGVAD
jgi:transcriptional regulator with XRE-family HTH domain